MTSLASKLHARMAAPTAANDIGVEKDRSISASGELHNDVLSKRESVCDDRFQKGVQRARAVTAVWSKKTLILMFILLYLVSFVEVLLTAVQGSLNPYVTSSFSKHGLLASTSVVASILSGSCTLSLAKIIDIWGRVQGFMFMVILIVVGMVMKAACQNMETYVAGHTLYSVGRIGILYVIDIMLSDMTSLRNRMLIITINGTPNIASTFAGPKIADLFYLNYNYRWAFGAFGIIMAGISLPVLVVMIWAERKAGKTGVMEERHSERTWWQSFIHYSIQLDVVGIILITASFSLFLLPFSISAYAPNGWKTGYIIAMIVLGVLLFPVFYVWERYFTRVPFLDWRYLKEPTIIGSCALYAFMFISIFIWNAFFSSYLQVVHRLSITTSNYVLNSFSLTSAIFSPLVGLFISMTGNFKWISISGIPFILLGTALLIPFRRPDTSVGILVMTQIFNGLGSGILATCAQLAIMAPVTHQEIAAVNAVWGLFGNIGASIGFAIAGGMWNNILPQELYNRLPAATKDQYLTIFGDIVVQMSYADGTPEREAVVASYAHVQRLMVIAGACFTPALIVCVWFWRNINVKKLEKEEGKQTVGTVW